MFPVTIFSSLFNVWSIVVHIFYHFRSYTQHDKFIVQPKDGDVELIINRLNRSVLVQRKYLNDSINEIDIMIHQLKFQLICFG